MANTSAVASWFTRETINEINDTDIDIHLEGDSLGVVPIACIPKYNDPKLRESNAQLICDAVNNTAGKGIDPNAVPGLLEALEIISEHAYDDDTPKGDILADFDNMRGLAINAIKAAELK